MPERPAPAALAVSFRVDPRVGERAPRLVVTVENPNAQAVPFLRFADARCFASHHLHLEVSRDGKPVALAPCDGEAGVAGELAAGARERVELAFTELAARWPEGTYEVVVRHETGQTQPPTTTRASRVSGVERFTIARPLKQFRIAVRESVKLPDGVVLEFTGHGHKRTSVGQSSPLIVGGWIKHAGGEREGFSVNVHTDESRVFSLADGRVFELVEHAYGEWMELRYYGQLAAL